MRLFLYLIAAIFLVEGKAFAEDPNYRGVRPSALFQIYSPPQWLAKGATMDDGKKGDVEYSNWTYKNGDQFRLGIATKGVHDLNLWHVTTHHMVDGLINTYHCPAREMNIDRCSGQTVTCAAESGKSKPVGYAYLDCGDHLIWAEADGATTLPLSEAMFSIVFRLKPL